MFGAKCLFTHWYNENNVPTLRGPVRVIDFKVFWCWHGRKRGGRFEFLAHISNVLAILIV